MGELGVVSLLLSILVIDRCCGLHCFGLFRKLSRIS
jgi:hypothetical protein